MDSTPTGEPVEETVCPSRGIPSGCYLCLLLLPVVGLAVYRLATTEPIPGRPIDRDAQPTPGLPIDPNVAHWWELTALPGIGEVTARKIVQYREAHRGQGDAADALRPGMTDVFQRPADLQQVKGIGPKTVARIESYLTFGQSPVNRGQDER